VHTKKNTNNKIKIIIMEQKDNIRELHDRLAPLFKTHLPIDDPSRSIFIPKPETLRWFTDEVLNTVISTLLDETTIVGSTSRHGGQLIVFGTSDEANEARSKFPASVEAAGKRHRFITGELPVFRNGVRVRISGLPALTTKEDICKYHT
jgi:hypothetical protein